MSDSATPETVADVHVARRKSRRTASLLLGLVIFVSGAMVGAGLAVLSIHAMVTYRFKHPEGAYQKIVDRIDRDVRLTPEQRKKVEEIVVRKQQDFMKILEEGHPKMEAHWQSVRDEIAAALDEKQAAMWKNQFDRMHNRLNPPFLPPPDDFGPPPPPNSH